MWSIPVATHVWSNLLAHKKFKQFYQSDIASNVVAFTLIASVNGPLVKKNFFKEKSKKLESQTIWLDMQVIFLEKQVFEAVQVHNIIQLLVSLFCLRSVCVCMTSYKTSDHITLKIL